MLSPADSSVVARDPALPGLAALLDAEAFLGHLRRACPAVDLRAASPIYLRYKPGTSCLAGFRLDVGGSRLEAYARTHRVGDEGKLSKVARAGEVRGRLGPGHFLLSDCGVLVLVFPNDHELDSLRIVGDPSAWDGLLRKMLSDYPGGWDEMRTLAYKPGRRYTGQVRSGGRPVAAVKFYTPAGYELATRNAKLIESGGALRVPFRLGRSGRYGVVALEWLPGRRLDELLPQPDDDQGAEPAAHTLPRAVARAGEALAELAARGSRKLPLRTREAEVQSLLEVARDTGVLWPPLADRARGLAERAAGELAGLQPIHRPIHGDFHPEQVLLDAVEGDRVALVDLDQAVLGDPASDLGNFIAHVERRVLAGDVPGGRARAVAEALCHGYEAAARDAVGARVRAYAAAQLLRLTTHPFRGREPDWPGRMAALLDRVADLLDKRPLIPPAALTRTAVSDPFDVPADPKLAFTRHALDPDRAREQLQQTLWEAGFDGRFDLCAIRVTRHKPGRRCLIEYDLERLEGSKGSRGPKPPRPVTLVGKVRAKGPDRSTQHLLEALWAGGFADDSRDGISVPRPVGLIPEFHMALQVKAPGVPATRLLPAPGGATVAALVADAIHKLHTANAPARRRHTMDDELRILHERLPLVSDAHPQWSSRIERVLAACDRLGAAVPPPSRMAGIHRDFYPDQVLVDEAGGRRLYLLDLDLYCEGDPALDVGNFVAHLTEQALRTTGDPAALADRERAMVDRFAALHGGGERIHVAVRSYATLTLARHIHISTLIPDRRHTTLPLLELCEDRLLGAAEAG